jgi:hypothetical protein
VDLMAFKCRTLKVNVIRGNDRQYVYTTHNFVSKEPSATVIRPILGDFVAERFACFQQRSKGLEATN